MHRWTILALTVACVYRIEDRDVRYTLEPTSSHGSSTLVVDRRVAYGVNAWDDTVVRSDLDAHTSDVWVADGEPTRIARVGGTLWVTLRAERQVVVLADEEGLVEVDRFDVGAEPYGIVASPDERSVYVALSQEDRIVELDATTTEVLRSWDVLDDPRWLAIHPSGSALYVTYGLGDHYTRISLRGDRVRTDALPEGAAGSALARMAGRVTGDPAVTDDGRSLILPVLYTDNATPGPQPELVDGTVMPPPVPYYTSSWLPVGRINPALVNVPLNADTGRMGEADVPRMVVGEDLGGLVRGAIASITPADPSGETLWVTLEPSDRVILVWNGGFVVDAGGGFEAVVMGYADVGSAPSAVQWTSDGEAWVQERGLRTLARLPAVSMHHDVVSAIVEAFRRRRLDTRRPDLRIAAGASRLDPLVEEGRRLFFSGTDPQVTVPGSASCNSCHLDGRTDGLTWAFDDTPRQTPSLAGPVSETAPVTWSEAVATVADEARLTATGRMGATAMTPEAAEALAAFVDWTRDVDIAEPRVDPAILELGEEVFHRPDVGCAECHAGPRFTDGFMYEIDDVIVATPSLVGVSATPPYLHDGRLSTLTDVLDWATTGVMGDTSTLTELEWEALEAYLESL